MRARLWALAEKSPVYRNFSMNIRFQHLCRAALILILVTGMWFLAPGWKRAWAEPALVQRQQVHGGRFYSGPLLQANQTLYPGPESSPTATSTATPTATHTSIPTQSTGTVTVFPSATATIQASPTQTTAPGTVLPTATHTNTPVTTSSPTTTPGAPALPSPTTPITETLPLGVTATLAPFPTVTYLYPQHTPTAHLLFAPRQPGAPELAKDDGPPTWQSLVRLVICGMVLLLWLVLAVWFVFSQRRLG